MRRIHDNCSIFPVHTEDNWLRDLHFSGQNTMLCFGGGDGAGHPSNHKKNLASARKHHSCQYPLPNERSVTRNGRSCFSPSKCCRACRGHEPSKTETFSFRPSSQWLAQGSGAKNKKKKTNSTKMKGKPPTPHLRDIKMPMGILAQVLSTKRRAAASD